MNYYNEFDPFAAAWLRELIKAKLIPQGDVDERSITEVQPSELEGYTQCHFFAGIGGWSLALRLADWPNDRPVWTGSCPCQPFSSAGNQKGKADERHLWPVWFNLIRECRPATIFGEQVSSAIAHGWLDDVYQGLEAEGYACGAAVLPACSVGAPHKRDRLWFVADSKGGGRGFWQSENFGTPSREIDSLGHHCTSGGREDSAIDVAYPKMSEQSGFGAIESWQQDRPTNSSAQFWQHGQWIDCPDGKQRLVEPSIPLLAHGVQNRVGKLRGYGNAIVPQVAAEFIGAFMEINQ